MPSLTAYLTRIGYAGPIEPTFNVLRHIHRKHLLTIPYENLDIHLGRALSLDVDVVFDKIVTRKRGGWCFEMNALLAWALREIGFDVTLLSGTVGRERIGDAAEGNHLVLLVKLDQPYVADVGFGNAFLEPLLLREGEHQQGRFVFQLERQGERWLFHQYAHGGPGFEFTLEPRIISDFAAQCHWLQTAPDSGFVRLAVCHHMRPDGVDMLRGAVLHDITGDGVTKRVLATEQDYLQALRGIFYLDLSEDDFQHLWPKVWASHLAWMAAQQT